MRVIIYKSHANVMLLVTISSNYEYYLFMYVKIRTLIKYS